MASLEKTFAAEIRAEIKRQAEFTATQKQKIKERNQRVMLSCWHGTAAAVELARRSALPGEVCNPSLDEGKFRPLPSHLAADARLTPGEKKFLAECACRARLEKITRARDLAEATGTSILVARRRIRKFRKMGWIVGRFYSIVPCLPADAGAYDLSIPEEMMRQKLLSDLDVIVYAVLAKSAGWRGWWYGAQSQLAKKCGCGLRSVKRSLLELKKRKLIRTDRRVWNRVASDKNSDGRVSAYWFLGHEIFRPRRDHDEFMMS